MKFIPRVLQPLFSVPSTVVLDANILYPFHKRAIFIHFFGKGLIRAYWSGRILEEWVNSVHRNKPEIQEKILAQETDIRVKFPEAMLTGFEQLEKKLDLPDPGDRHVLAAAIHGKVPCIVTDNLKDFPAANLAPYGVEAIGSDAFLCRIYDLYPEKTRDYLSELRKKYKEPPYSPSEFGEVLDKCRMGEFAKRLRFSEKF